MFLQFILFHLLLSQVVCSDEVLWPTSDFLFFWHLVMNDDGVMWKMVNTPRKKRMFVRWCGDVQESLKRSSYNTKCTIFCHSSMYIAIQNVQNVEYSTIPKYTEYTKYTKYTTYSTVVFFLYTLQYLHVPWFLQPYCTKSSLSALMRGSNLYNSFALHLLGTLTNEI